MKGHILKDCSLKAFNQTIAEMIQRLAFLVRD